MLPAQPNQSLMNGLACLQAVVTSDRPIGSREVARRLGLEHTRVNRLLGTLSYLGFIERTASRKYRPGPGIHVLSAQSLRGSGLLAAALPHLRTLVAEKLIVAMGVLWDRNICYLVHATPGLDPGDAIGGHQLYPAHESIIGLAIMAHMTDAQVRTMLAAKPGPLPRKAIADVLEHVREARAAGYALQPTPTGRFAVSHVVGSPPAAAIAFSGIPTRARAVRLAPVLQQVAETITAELEH